MRQPRPHAARLEHPRLHGRHRRREVLQPEKLLGPQPHVVHARGLVDGAAERGDDVGAGLHVQPRKVLAADEGRVQHVERGHPAAAATLAANLAKK